MNEKAFIPLYLNSNMVDNLFTILIEEFSITQKDSVKEQIILNVDTPLREIIKDRYVQGDIRLQVLNEYSRENTEQRMVKKISVFLQLMKILKQNNLIKNISSQNISKYKLSEGDYIEIKCELSEDPLIEWFKDLKKTVSTLSYLDKSKSDELKSSDFMMQVEDNLKTYNESKSTRLVMEDIHINNSIFSFLIEDEFVEGNLKYMLEGPVTVIGKIIKKTNLKKETTVKANIVSENSNKIYTYCSDFLKHMEMNSLKYKINSMQKIYKDINIPKKIFNHGNIENFYNIIPLAIIF